MNDGQGNRLERDQEFGQCSLPPFFSFLGLLVNNGG